MLETAIIFSAKYLIYIEALAFCAFIFLARRRVRNRLLIISVIALPLAYLLGKIASYFWYDTRPFVETGIAPLIAHAADNGFPSDHMLLGATLASIVTLRNPRWGIVFWIGAVTIGTARMAAHIHHPIDILASAIIGAASAYIAFYFVVLRPMRSRKVAARIGGDEV